MREQEYENQSRQTDGDAASRNMSGISDLLVDQRRPASSLDVVSELGARMKRLEASNAELAKQLDAAKRENRVEPYPGYDAHVAHVMQKHFFHDRPDPAEGERDSRYGG